MKKKKILLTLALLASVSLASCGGVDDIINSNNIESSQAESSTISSSIANSSAAESSINVESSTASSTALPSESYQLKKDRGSEETGSISIKLPDAVIKASSSQSSSNVDVTPDEEIDVIHNNNHVETDAGNTDYQITDNEIILNATVNIGYEFIGWFRGNEFISNETNIKVSKDDTNIVARYKLKDSFENLIFESNENECNVLGLKETTPYLIIPEGVTSIQAYAFEELGIYFVELPSTLKSIGERAFYDSALLRIEFKSIPETMGYEIAEYTSLMEAIIPTDYQDTDNLEYHLDCSNLNYVNDVKDSIYHIYDDFVFIIDSNNDWALFKYIGNDKDVILPSDIKDIKEYYIDSYAFYYSNFETVEIPNCVIAIGNYAFENCEKLKNVIIPDSVVYIGEYAFYECLELEEVTIGKNVDTIGNKAFCECSKLYTVINYSKLDIVLGESSNGYVAYYAYELKNNKEESSNVKIDDNFKYFEDEDYVVILGYLGDSKDIEIPTFKEKEIIIADNAFASSDIESIKLNEYVTTIGEYAFYRCENLKAFDGLNVDAVGEGAFEDCYKLASLKLPKVLVIPSYLCEYCHNLVELDISSATTIGSYSFCDCFSLYQVTLPSTLTDIEYNAFSNCYNLVEVINKSSLELSAWSSNYGNVANNAFSVITDEKDSIIKTNNGIVTYYDSNNEYDVLITVNDKDIKELKLPDDVKSIRRYALYGLELEYLSLNGMDNYLAYYFGADYYDEFYYVPETLKTVELGSSVESIPYYAFYKLNIETIKFGNSVKSVDSNAFYDTKLKEVYYDGTEFDWCSISFSGLQSNPAYSGNVDVYFKEEDKDPYLVTTLDLNNEYIDTVCQYQFAGFKVESVSIKYLSYIYEYAFYNCGKLKEFDFTKVDNIYEYAFANSELEKVEFGDDINYVGSYAFSGCQSLKSVYISSGLEEISEYLFMNCTNLQKVTLSEGVCKIYDSAFCNCMTLYTINFPTTLESIGYKAFYKCENLDEALLKDTNVKTLPGYAFAGCSNLVGISLPEDLEDIDSTTFEDCDRIAFETYKNACYYGTASNPYRWLIKARTKTIAECEINSKCEKVFDGAFSKCSNLRKMVIPAECNNVENMLKGLKKIEYLEFPYNGLTTFGKLLFGVENTSIPTSLKTVIINGGTLVDNAFKDCSNIESITFKEGYTITEIPTHAFEDCSSLEIEVPQSVTKVGAYAYKGTKIRSLVVEPIEGKTYGNLETIGAYAFSDCDYLETVDLTYAVIHSAILNETSIGAYVFKNCRNLTEAKLYNNMWYLTAGIFENCTSLTSITIPTETHIIREDAFKNSGLTEIIGLTNAYALTTLENGCFEGTKITTVTVPSLNQSFGAAFRNCKNLTKATINANFVGPSAFEGCTALNNVVINNSSFNSIRKNAFKGCTALTSFNFSKVKTIWTNAFEGSGITSFTTSNAIEIGSSAFLNCKDLTTVNISNTESKFGYKIDNYSNDYGRNAFEGCSSLVSVTLPSTVTTIPANTFKDCTGLTTFDFSQYATLGYNSFENTGFTTLELPSNINTIGDAAFTNCKNLESVILNCSLGSNDNIFLDCAALTSVTLNGNETTISPSAFMNCTALKEFTFDSTITKIGDKAFYNTGLEELNLPESIATIGQYAFYQTKITELVVPDTVTSVGNYAFSETPLTKVTFNGKTVGSYAFKKCKQLEEVTVSGEATTISSYAFESCNNLNKLILGQNITSINNGAFTGCYKLIEIYNLSSLELTKGANTNGNVALYAKIIHTSLDEESSFVTINGYNFTCDQGECFLLGYSGADTELVLPESVQIGDDTYTSYEIVSYSFYENKNIESIIIPDAVTSIGNYAFYQSSIQTVKMGKNVTSIGEKAFYCADNLYSVTLSESLETIGENAFNGAYRLVEIYNLSNISLTLGNNDNGYVSANALVIHTSSSEQSIIVKNGDDIFAYDGSTGYYVGYVGTSFDIVIPGSFEYNNSTITDLTVLINSFYGSDITSVEILDGVKKIGNYAFGYCDKLKTVIIADSVGNYDYHPFYGTFAENIKAPARMCYFLGNPYKYSSTYSSSTYNNKLKTVVITSGRMIDSYSFTNNTSIESVIIPTSVKKIEAYAFYGGSTFKAYYEGTEEEYKNIDMYYNPNLANSTKYFYSETKPEKEGNYWHYDENHNPVIWE